MWLLQKLFLCSFGHVRPQPWISVHQPEGNEQCRKDEILQRWKRCGGNRETNKRVFAKFQNNFQLVDVKIIVKVVFHVILIREIH